MIIRNYLFELHILKSESYPFPVICVGNLSVGGTGKTPMIEYLLKLLLPDYNVATLSRGYGRNTKGFRLVTTGETAENVGDEPLQFKNKFENAVIAVDEDRRRGITKLRKDYQAEVILLDDAFQHRKVKAGLNILLTRYEDLYEDDFMLPTGNLREPGFGANRANIIVVTKCPKNLSESEQDRVREKIKPKNHQSLFFSYIRYSDFVYNGREEINIEELGNKEITLVTGIANPGSLCQFLNDSGITYTHLDFPDHHKFSSAEINEISKSSLIVTTEKDFMRLKGNVAQEKLFYLPIAMSFVGHSDLERFNNEINEFVGNEK